MHTDELHKFEHSMGPSAQTPNSQNSDGLCLTTPLDVMNH